MIEFFLNIFRSLFILFIKLFFSIFVILLAFIEKVLTLIATVASILGKLLFFLGILTSCLLIYEHGFTKEIAIPVLISFIGFILPYVVMVVPATIGVIREKITEFIIDL